MAASHRKRKQTYNTPGHAHHLTCSCVHRWPLLAQDRTRRWVVQAMDAARLKHDVAIWAYVVMPEHIHLLVCPRQADYSIERFLSALKRPVSWQAKQYLIAAQQQQWLGRLTVAKGSRKVFRFWQPGGGYDENVVQDRAVHEIVDYVHGNPVRRGLVDKSTDWVWSSARFWAGQRCVPMKMDPLVL